MTVETILQLQSILLVSTNHLCKIFKAAICVNFVFRHPDSRALEVHGPTGNYFLPIEAAELLDDQPVSTNFTTSTFLSKCLALSGSLPQKCLKTLESSLVAASRITLVSLPMSD
jgi:hypothetical protein